MTWLSIPDAVLCRAAFQKAFARRASRVVLCAATGLAVSSSSPHAETVMSEQDVDETTLEHALNPAGDDVVRGFVLSDDTGQPAAAPPSASMLITFASNSAMLTSSAKAALDKVGRALDSDRLAAYRFRVEGHADPRGAADANMRLSAERAAAVVEYLTSRGVEAQRLSSIGKGSSEPLNRRNPAAPENRRVTIVTLQE